MKNNEVPLPKNDGKHRKWLYEIELLYANFELHRPAFMTLEPIRWRYKFCCEAEKWWVTTTTLLLVEKLSKMNCTHFGQNIHKTNEKWRYLEIFINKNIRHLEKNSKSGNTLKDEALFTGTL